MHAFLLDLLPYLLGFYLFEGVSSLRPFQFLLVSGGLRAQLRSDRLLLTALFPFDEVVAAEAPPLLMTGRGLYFLDPSEPAVPSLLEAASLQFVEWRQLGEIGLEGRFLRAGDRTLYRAVTPAHARAFASGLRAVAAAPESQRWALIERSRREAFALAPLRALRARQRPYRIALRVLCLLYAFGWAALGILLLSGVPGGSLPPLGRLLGLLAALHGGILLGTVGLLHRGGSPLGQIAAKVAPLLLPFSAAHALAVLSRDLYARWALPALAAALLPTDSFRAFARTELTRLAASVRAAGDSDLARSLRLEEQAWKELLLEAGLPREEVLAPPAPSDPEAARYCPLCAAEYRAGFECCEDCAVPLVALGE